MGFLYYAIKVPTAIITASLFLNIFVNARFILIGALTHLGLYKPPPEEEPTNNSNNYILILDSSSPSLVPIPVHVVTAAIKNRVPIVKYQDLLLLRHHHQQQQQQQQQDESVEQLCSVCLECIKWSDDVRELCNCSHLFHRECLDTWIDEGQVTCPLCRSMLLPPKTNLFRCNPKNLDDAHLVAAT